MEQSVYKCPLCEKLLLRESTKKWISSYCEVHEKVVRIQFIKTMEPSEKIKEILKEE